jgi:hypothetical protein
MMMRAGAATQADAPGPASVRMIKRQWASSLGASAWFLVLAVVATAPALFDERSLGPDSLLDGDALYGVGAAPPRPLIPDPSRTVYDFPRDFAAAAGFAQGRLDLWNPRAGFGMPLWAEGHTPFAPFTLLFFAVPSRRMYDIATALRLVVAGLGAYLLARRCGLARVPALAAGTVFELSGSMVTLLAFGSGSPVSLLPWVVLGAEAIARERRLAAAAGTALALGVAGNSGHPMLALLVFAAFGTAIAAHMVARRDRAVAIAALGCLAVTIGLSIAAPALLPLFELRSVGRLYKDVLATYESNTATWLTCSRRLLPLAAFAPLVLANVRAALLPTLPYALSPVIGVLGLILALGGLLRRRLSAGLFAVGLLGLAMTVAPPGLGWVRQIPPLGDVWPPYSWSLLALPLSIAAGWGVAAVETRADRWTLLIALILFLAGSSSLVFLQNSSLSLLVLKVPIRDVFLHELGNAAGWVRLVLPIALAMAVVILAAAAPVRLGRHCALLVTGLCALELIVTLAPTAWYDDAKVLGLPPSPPVLFLQKRLAGNQFRMLGTPTFGRPSTTALFGLQDVNSVSGLPVERYVQYLQAISLDAGWYFVQYPGPVFRHPLLDLGAVRYVVRPAGRQAVERLEDDPEVPLVYRDARIAIYENTAALPRARIVHAAVAVRDQEEANQRLTEAASDASHAAGAGLADRIFVEPADQGLPVPDLPERSAPAGEQVEIIDDGDPDRVELAAVLHDSGWVVLADTFYPGWTATVDGMHAPIYPTDLLFRSVCVPAGSHRIIFAYRSRSFWLGVTLAAVGLAGSGLLIMRGSRSAARQSA